MKMSKSKVLCYMNCPRHFKFKYIDELPEAMNIYAKRGIDVHAALDKFHKELDVSKVTNPDKDFNMLLKKIAIEMFGDDGYTKYENYFVNFVRYEAWKWYNTINKEHFKPKFMEKRLDSEKVRGIIDRIDYIEDVGYILLDYKTGGEKNIKHFMFELSLYAFLVYECLGIKVVKVGIFWLKETKKNISLVVKTADLTGNDVKKALDYVNNVQHAVENEEFDKPQERNCFFCGYKKACDMMDGKTSAKDII